MFSKLTTRTSPNGGQYSSRNGRKIDRFIVHHAATTSTSGVLNMMSTGSREVSANYVLGNGQIIGVVPEEYRAWTSGSSLWDGRSITVETVNNSIHGWTIAEVEFDNLAKLIADVAVRHGFPVNRDTVIGHRELHTRYGASYPTACPGGINLDQLVKRAQGYTVPAAVVEGFMKDMTPDQQREVYKILKNLDWLAHNSFAGELTRLGLARGTQDQKLNQIIEYLKRLVGES